MAKSKAPEETQEQRAARLRRFVVNFCFTLAIRESGRADQLAAALLGGTVTAEQFGVITGGDRWRPHPWNPGAYVRLGEAEALDEAVTAEPEMLGFVVANDCVELYRRRK